jgi:hypothetical protein
MTAHATPPLGGSRLVVDVKTLALDLFWDPNGVRATAEYWLATYSDRIKDPLPHTVVCSLLHELLHLEACELEFAGYTRANDDLQWILFPFRNIGACAFSHNYFVRHERHRALAALSEILPYEWHGVRAFPLQNKDTVRGDLICSEFVQNDVLRAMIDVGYLIVALLDVFTLALYEIPLLWKDEPEFADELLMPISRTLVESAVLCDERVASLCADLGVMFAERARDVPALRREMEEIAAGYYRQMYEQWSPPEIAQTRALFNNTVRRRPKATRPTEVVSDLVGRREAGREMDRPPDVHSESTNTMAMDLDT